MKPKQIKAWAVLDEKGEIEKNFWNNHLEIYKTRRAKEYKQIPVLISFPKSSKKK